MSAAKTSWTTRLGWWLVTLSVPIWCVVFVAPFLPLEAAWQALVGALAIALGEGMFWLGLALLGPVVAARLRPPRVDSGRSFAGKRVAVLGATGGLGEAIVAALRRESAEVLALGRDPLKLSELAARHDTATLPIDLTRPATITAAAAQAGELDAVIVAAGVDVRKSLLAHDDADVEVQLAINLQAPILLTRAFAPRLRAGGVIAHLGGFGDGRLALPYYSADVASRAGLAAFCESANREFALEGLDVTVAYLCPAPADTLAERPFAGLWTDMGTPPVAPAAVADFVLRAVLARKQAAVMGCSTWWITKANGLSASIADRLALRRVGRSLQRVFGDPSRARSAVVDG